ncbi:MAG: ABC transporter ATP-binding protein [Bacteroidales bacterium]|jgi:NitT/TauT family transport system ATP-binding protein|nr:ABC transporter ATP-binding protein [Bacteroidales bacterium]
MNNLQIHKLYKSFGDITLFRDFSLEIKEHTITCILGPSGCGKTTLLNMISNTTQPDTGEFTGFANKIISYIFQEPRLLPWKTVIDNIAFVLNDSISSKEKRAIAAGYSQMVELEKFNNYYPSQLSGGMKQRVAIARAFCYPSEIILMDEPLKALDLRLKMNLMKSFRRLWQRDKRTVIFVTHDIDEALLLGNDIYVFSKAPVEIKKKFAITQKERSLHDPYFLSLKNEIWEEMD